MKKTNAARILDRLNVHYRLQQYTVESQDVGAPAVAEKIGLPVGQVFKTLVVCGDKTGVLMACVPGAAELDLKALAATSGNKRVEMAPLKNVLAITGYIRGGVSPLGAKKLFPIYIDESIGQWSEIAVSAGVRGCQILIAPADLVEATAAVVAPLVR